MKRSSAILLPITALPSPHGCGTLGQAAYDFLDFLQAAGQSYWQLLPIGPVGGGDSPYSSCSSYAGEPLLIDLDLLCEQGLLQVSELAELDAAVAAADPAYVDYELQRAHKLPLLRKAAERAWQRMPQAMEDFSERHKAWLDDYSLYMALKNNFGGAAWTEWPPELQRREPAAMVAYRVLLADEIRYQVFLQYIFARQWDEMRRRARERGIAIIGDLPIYVPLDSADIWAEPRWFRLDAELRPQFVSGCPPDAFAADGQLWGNPLYDWERMRNDGYGWWIRRLGAQAERFEVLRIDHFRGLESYWAIPADSASARDGHWEQGPGLHFVRTITQWFHDLQIIAEDLGYLTPEVHHMRDAVDLPGMKVLQFAFDSREPSDYLPHNYPKNCICYSGTHDNSPLAAWLTEAAPEDVAYAKRYLGLNEGEGLIRGIIRGGMSSVADLFVAQMQDWLELPAASRTNIPGTTTGNWRWRLLPQQATDALAQEIRETTQLYGRLTC